MPRVTVLVKPNARKEGVEALPGGELRVAVNAPPQEGRANEAVARVLAEHFGVPKSAVRLVMGARSKRKVYDVDR